MSRVSVVIPVKNSERHIRTCVDSLLSQEHEDFEVIVVGDERDSSWRALGDIHDRRLRCLPVKVSMNGATRDANLKRRIGLTHATGDVLALTDSDMVLRPGWISGGVAMLEDNAVVASSMISRSSSFVGRYVDDNALGSRYPSYTREFTLTRETYGRPGFKPPVTANLFMRREVVEATGGPDPSFTRSYEDYEWARRIIDAGFDIRCTDKLASVHNHRTSPGQLMRDSYKAGRGCADYVVTFPRCRFSRMRVRQAGMSLLGVLAALLGIVADPRAIVAFAAMAVGLTLVSWAKVGRPAGALYPLITLPLGLAFVAGLVVQLFANRPRIRFMRAELPLPSGALVPPLPVPGVGAWDLDGATGGGRV
jgi:glycosyltransferase involved in cell wall biosynthesis